MKRTAIAAAFCALAGTGPVWPADGPGPDRNNILVSTGTVENDAANSSSGVIIPLILLALIAAVAVAN